MGTEKSSRLVILASVSLVLLTMNLVGADPNAESLREVIRRLQPKLKAEATEMDLMFWPTLLTKFPDLQHLTTNARQYKAAAVDLVIESAREKGRSADPMPFTNQSTLLIGAMYGLSPTDYMEFADQVLSRAKSERVTLDDAEVAALISPRHELTGLFARNYQHPRVREILEKAKRLWVTQSPAGKTREPNLAKAIDETLSGRTAQWLDRQKERYPEEYPNNLNTPVLVAIEPKPGNDIAAEAAPPMTPRPSTPVASQIPAASPQPTTPVAQTSAAAVEQRTPVWPWLVGIVALIAIIAIALKRRA
jgi:hypothetical protein